MYLLQLGCHPVAVGHPVAVESPGGSGEVK